MTVGFRKFRRPRAVFCSCKIAFKGSLIVTNLVRSRVRNPARSFRLDRTLLLSVGKERLAMLIDDLLRLAEGALDGIGLRGKYIGADERAHQGLAVHLLLDPARQTVLA